MKWWLSNEGDCSFCSHKMVFNDINEKETDWSGIQGSSVTMKNYDNTVTQFFPVNIFFSFYGSFFPPIHHNNH